MCLYINDFFAHKNVQALDDLGFAYYMRMLMHTWVSEKAYKLPNIEAELILAAGCKDIEEWASRRELILRNWPETKDKKWRVNGRLKEEYEKLMESHRRRQMAGKKGGLAKAMASNATAMPKQSLATHTHTQTQTKPKDKTSSPPAKRDPRFEPIRGHIEKCCTHAKVPFVWDASEAKHLSDWLKATPNVIAPIETCIEFVKNRFRLAREPGERPRKWIGDLGKFATGQSNHGTNKPGTFATKQQTIRSKNAESSARLLAAAGATGSDAQLLHEGDGRSGEAPVAGTVIEIRSGRHTEGTEGVDG
jgi:uncharacterized protein YdaU (DUF1376 family)